MIWKCDEFHNTPTQYWQVHKNWLSNLCILAGSVSTLKVSPEPVAFQGLHLQNGRAYLWEAVCPNIITAEVLLDDRGKETILMQALEHSQQPVINDCGFNFPHRMYPEHVNFVWTGELLNLESVSCRELGRLFKINKCKCKCLYVVSWQLVDRV